MANIATLATSLTAKTSKLRKGLLKGVNLVKNFAGNVARSVGKGVAVAGVGVAGLVGAVTTAGVAAVKGGADQVLFARRLGATSDQMAVLELAGRRAGLTVEQVRMATQRFARRTQEAAAGGGELKKTLEEMGIDAKAFVKIPIDERITEFGKALFSEGRTLFDALPGVTSMARLSGRVSDVGAETNITARAFKGFDSEGVGMINTMRVLIDEHRTLSDEAKKLGITTTKEEEEALVNAAAAMRTALEPITGLIDRLGIEMAPTVERVAMAIREFSQGIIQNAGGAEKLSETIVRVLVGGFLLLIDTIAKASNAIFDFVGFSIRSFVALSTAIAGVVDFITNLASKFPGVAGLLGIESIKPTDFASAARQTGAELVQSFEQNRPTFDTGQVDRFVSDIANRLGVSEVPALSDLFGGEANQMVDEQKETNAKLGEIIEFSVTRNGTTKQLTFG